MCCVQKWQLLETLWFQQALDHAWVSFFSSFTSPAERLLCFWLQLPVSPSQSSLLSGLVCCLELCDNGKCRLWGFKLDLVAYWGKFSLPPPPLTMTSPGEKCFAFSSGEKKRPDLLHGVSDHFQGQSRGSELPSWAWKCQYWCNEESPVEK